MQLWAHKCKAAKKKEISTGGKTKTKWQQNKNGGDSANP